MKTDAIVAIKWDTLQRVLDDYHRARMVVADEWQGTEGYEEQDESETSNLRALHAELDGQLLCHVGNPA